MTTIIETLGYRYQVMEQIGSGGMGSVFRAYDRLTSQTVALKRITVPTEQLQFTSKHGSIDFRLALAQEFRTLASLRHPNIISVLDYGFDTARQPYFTMEWLSGAETITQACRGKSVEFRLRLLTQATQALMYLHRRGVIHRDIKPDNVLVNQGTVRVLDFGLAIANNDHTEMAGTLAYMAPETLQGQTISPLSDLYALGVIAYEMFAERFPYTYNTYSELIEQIVSVMPPIDELDIDERIADILSQLLQKDPQDRLADARTVLDLLAQIEGRETVETKEIRESFLQAAQLVGREEELAMLSSALDAMLNGAGSAWLMGGESGIGKSRVLDEHRSHALVQGVTVLRGQAISDGGSPYQLWQNVLQYVALLVEPNGLDAQILKPYVPEIERFVGQAVNDPPPLDPSAVRTRLLATVWSYLLTAPVLLIFEDLHWASTESLELLKAFVNQVSQERVMVVASFRDDEAPQLVKTLDNMRLYSLKRLSDRHVQALSESMLGDVATKPQVRELLQQETEGNVFFLVETVRALAEDAGQLSQIGTSTLPEHILAGGVKRLIERRLKRVPSADIPLLQYAAIIGRRIEPSLLARLAPNVALEAWLTRCSDAVIIEFSEGSWRFNHDKLREGILSQLTNRTTLHRDVAVALEATQGDRAADALTYHWGKAQDATKEAYYAKIAGEQALLRGANAEAVQFLKIAFSHQPSPTVERQLGQAYYGLGDLREARDHLRNVLQTLGYRLPRVLVLGLVQQLGSRLLRGLGMRKTTSQPIEQLREGARIYGLLGEITYFTADTLLGVYCVLKMLNLAEMGGESPELARAYVNMCIATSLVPLPQLAYQYAEKASELAERIQHPISIARVANISGVFYIGYGEWEKATQALDLSLKTSTTIGDRVEANQTVTTRAIMKHYIGDFAEARRLNELASETALKIGNRQQHGWGVYSRAENLNRLELYDEAYVSVKEIFVMFVGNIETSSFIRMYAALAVASMGLNLMSEALEYTQKSIQYLGNSAPNIYSMLDSYATQSDVYLTYAEQTQNSTQRAEYTALGAKNLKTLAFYARLYPVGRPRLHLFKGRLAQLKGDTNTAQTEFEWALDHARQLKMQYDIRLAKGYLKLTQ